jgi:methylaspartate ammonia-lyase
MATMPSSRFEDAGEARVVVDELHELVQRPVNRIGSAAEEFTDVIDIIQGNALTKQHLALFGTVGLQGLAEEASQIMTQVFGSLESEARQQILEASDPVQAGHCPDVMEDITRINLVVTDDGAEGSRIVPCFNKIAYSDVVCTGQTK